MWPDDYPGEYGGHHRPVRAAGYSPVNRGGRYSPVNRGGRFSRKAAIPSA
jgi:hypothetical protein